MDVDIIDKHIIGTYTLNLFLKYSIIPITAGASDMLSSIGYASETILSSDGSKSPASMKKYVAIAVTPQLERIATTIVHFGIDTFNDFTNNMKNGTRHIVPIINAASAKDGNGFSSSIISSNEKMCCATRNDIEKMKNIVHMKTFLRSMYA